MYIQVHILNGRETVASDESDWGGGGETGKT